MFAPDARVLSQVLCGRRSAARVQAIEPQQGSLARPFNDSHLEAAKLMTYRAVAARYIPFPARFTKCSECIIRGCLVRLYFSLCG